MSYLALADLESAARAHLTGPLKLDDEATWTRIWCEVRTLRDKQSKAVDYEARCDELRSDLKGLEAKLMYAEDNHRRNGEIIEALNIQVLRANVVIQTYEDILRFVTSYIDSKNTTVTDFVLCLCKNARHGADVVAQRAKQTPHPMQDPLDKDTQ